MARRARPSTRLPHPYAETLVPVPGVRLGRTVHDDWRQHLPSASTNGLASGNTRAEAIVHGLCEVMERDALSCLTYTDQAELLDPVTVNTPYCAALLERLNARGCWWELRHVPNRWSSPSLAERADMQLRVLSAVTLI